MLSTLAQFVGLLNSLAIFPNDRNLFFRECRSSAAYSTVAFLLAVTIIEVSFTFIACLVRILLSVVCPSANIAHQLF